MEQFRTYTRLPSVSRTSPCALRMPVTTFTGMRISRFDFNANEFAYMQVGRNGALSIRMVADCYE